MPKQIRSFLTVCCCSLAFVLPDLLLTSVFKTKITISFLLCIFILSALLSLVQSKKFLFVFFTVFFFFQIVQINHWLYFGTAIHPNDISKVFFEMGEITQSGLFVVERLWQGWLILLMCLMFCFYAIKHSPIIKKKTYSDWIIAFLILLYPLGLSIKGFNSLKISHDAPVCLKTYRSVSVWFLSFFYSIKGKTYADYNFEKKQPLHDTVVLIMGESICYRYMSLYGYSHKTTPYLSSMKNNPHFSYAKGISSSVCTETSLPLFFNCVREPQNLKLIDEKTVNLFKIAKSQGYKTTLITAQNPKLMSSSGIEYVDEVIDLQKESKEQSDDCLIDAFLNINKSDRHFIVLHLRHVHSPYETFFSKQKSIHSTDKNKKAYENALLYHDEWVQKMISKLPKGSLLIFTSDHGEILGEKGLYGHTILDPLVVDVPIWAYYEGDSAIVKEIKKHDILSHYDVAVILAYSMGISILNPNDDKTTSYVQGSDLFSNNFRYLSFDKQAKIFDFSNAND